MSQDYKLDEQRKLVRASTAGPTLEALDKRITGFEAALKADEEIGAWLAFIGQAVRIRVRSIEFEDPTIIVLKGLDDEGREVVCLQHLSQVSLMLVPMKTEPGATVHRLRPVP